MYPKKLTPETIPDAGVRARIGIERKIVLRLIDDLLAAGCELSVYDGEEQYPWTTDRAAVIDAIMNTDEDALNVRRLSDGLSGWVHLVYGNDGWDVICDYTLNIEPLLAGVNAYAETLEG
jgi:hypothetical protein